MRLNLLIADFSYVGAQRSCLFDGESDHWATDERGDVGRADSCRFVVDGDPSVSRRHLVVLFRDGRFFLRNLSRFGTSIVGKHELVEIGSEAPIEGNDRILIGRVELVASVQSSGAPVGMPAGRGVESPKTADDYSRSDGPVDHLPENDTSIVSQTGESALPRYEPSSIRLPRVGSGKVAEHSIPDDLDLLEILGVTGRGASRRENSRDREPEAATFTRKPLGARDSNSREPLHSSSESRRADALGRRQDPASRDELVGDILVAAGIAREDVEGMQVSPSQIGELLGALSRAMALQFAMRENFRRAFRLASHSVLPIGNNPFSRHLGSRGLPAELVDPKAGFVGGIEAVESASLELQAHDAAVADSIRSAFESLLEFLDPSTLEAEIANSPRSFIDQFKPGAGDAAAWRRFRDMYEEHFRDRHRAFLTVYLERFGADYEIALKGLTGVAESKAGRSS